MEKRIVSITFRTDENTKYALQKIAFNENKSLSNICERELQYYLYCKINE